MVGVNSHNVAQPLVQIMAHFVWANLRVVEGLGVEPGNPGAQSAHVGFLCLHFVLNTPSLSLITIAIFFLFYP